MIRQFLTAAAIAASLFSTSLHAEVPDVPYAGKALEIYKTIIGMRTAKGHGNVPTMARYLAAEFEAGGFAAEDITLAEMDKTALLIVRYKGDGSLGKKPIAISAHMDVVDALPEDWERDPFTLIEENGYFYGRGSLDNKMGIAAASTVFLRMRAEGYVPGRDLILTFSGDEETGMTTTKALVTDYLHLTDSEFMLNTDMGAGLIPEGGDTPTNFGMQAAEKTYATFEMTARNPGGHSSRPRPDNAIYDLADAIKRIQAYTFPARLNELTKAYFEGLGKNMPGDLGKAMLAFAADPTDDWAIRTLRADSSFVGTVGTTCVATMLSAGHAENALPQSATATINCRIFPGEGVDLTLARLKKAIGNDAIEFTYATDFIETDASPLRTDVIAALQKAIDIRYPGLEIVPMMSSGGTDGMYFRQAGIPSYGVNGLYIKSSDVYAHGLNERVPVDSFYGNLTHWYVLLKELSQ